jgi:hypothetical protein
MAKYLGTKEKVKKGLMSIAEALAIIPANTNTYRWLKNKEEAGLKFSAPDADKKVKARRRRKRRKRVAAGNKPENNSVLTTGPDALANRKER